MSPYGRKSSKGRRELVRQRDDGLLEVMINNAILIVRLTVIAQFPKGLWFLIAGARDVVRNLRFLFGCWSGSF